MRKSVSYILSSVLVVLFAFIANIAFGQFELQKTVDNTTPEAGEVFNYILDAACNSSVSDCESAVIVDPLPPSLEFIAFSLPLPDGVADAVYDVDTHTATITFDAESCASCSPDGINTDNDDFAQGSTIQLYLQVRFPEDTFTGTVANNHAQGSSDNAGSPYASAPEVVSTQGVLAETNCSQLYTDFSTTSETSPGSLMWMRLRVGNAGFSDITNWQVIVPTPPNTEMFEINTPDIPGTILYGEIYYELSNNLGNFIYGTDFNTGDPRTYGIWDLGLPPGVTVTSTRINIGWIPGTGEFNPFAYNHGWDSTFRLYARVLPTAMNGDVINACAYYSGIIDGNNCSEDDCDGSDIVAQEPVITGGKENQNSEHISQQIFSPGEEINVEINFASDEQNSTPVLGGVLVDVLPPGMTYVSHNIPWGSYNIQDLEPVLEIEFLPDGRQLVRFVWDASLGNEFEITPIGGWSGFAIDITVQIGAGVASGNYANEYYWAATGSDHDCDWLSGTDINNYLDGYSFDGDYCYQYDDLDIVIQPGSAGLESKKEVLGTKDTDYHRYPEVGQTVPGGLNNYKITLTNPNATPINDIVIIDVFPYINDTEVLEVGTPRFSAWQPVLAAPIPTPAGVSVEYTTVNNPCRDELAGPGDTTPFPTGCNNPAWTTTPPLDLTTVTAVRFDFGAVTLSQGESVEINMDMRAPFDAPDDGSIAWNSFAYVATNATTGDVLLPAEPIKVGIELVPADIPFLGDFVWNDINQNGLQDPGEPGLDGVRINLYVDSNGNGIAETGIDDLHTFSISSGGGQYLFSDFPFGRDYFLEFTDFPGIFTPTHSNQGADPSVDSEPAITPVFSVTNTTDDRLYDFGLFAGTVTPLIDLSGTVFEDINYGGGDGRSYADADISAQSSGWPADEIGVENAVVELYDAAGDYVAVTTTDADGVYTFSNIVNGVYQVRVVNQSIISNRPSNSTLERIIPVQTFRTDGTTDVISEIGGSSYQLVDAGPNSSGLNISLLSTASTDAQSVTQIDLMGTNTTGVDFGYNFDIVVNRNESGQGSLRQWIFNSNELDNTNLDQEDNPTNGVSFPKDPEWETSIFMIPGAGPHRINPLTAFEYITDDQTHLTGYTQAGSSQGTNDSRVINIEIDGNTDLYNGVSIFSDDVQVSGLSVHSFQRSIYSFQANSTNNHIWGNYVGLESDGLSIEPTFSGTGITLYRVYDSFVGTNGDNVNDANEGNVVANSYTGIEVRATSGVLVAGNYVGIDKTGSIDLGSRYNGIFLRDPAGPNVIGFDDNSINTNADNFRNVSSGNGNDGIRVSSGDNQVIAGNYLGTDATGTFAIGNGNYGIQIQGDVNNLIIGTDSDGDDDIKERNIMSGNGTGMRFLVGTTGTNNRVSGNFVGTDVTGNLAVPNLNNGIDMTGPMSGTVIGTNADNVNDEIEGNVISGNIEDGIRIDGTNDNIIAGNNIGVAFDGSALGNGKRGIILATTASRNIIGYSPSMLNSDELIVGNNIKYNDDSGIALAGTGTQNRFSRNQLYNNGGLGIDLDYDLVTVNDNGDIDIGPNDLLNFPVFETSEIIGTNLVITGYAPAGSEIEFFIKDGFPNPDPLPASYSTSFGEGSVYLFTAFEGGPLDMDSNVDTYEDDGTGSNTIKTQNRFNFTFDITGLGVTDPTLITATATNSDNSTSEFSGWTPCTQLDLEVVGMDLSDCSSSNSSVTLNAFGGTEPYSFNIGSGPQASGVFTGLATGYYYATVTDAQSCTMESSFYISCPVECPNTDFTELITSCFNFGGYQGAYASNDAIVGFPANLSGNAGINSATEMTHYATHEQVGTVYGVAISQSRRTLYTAAYMKRHAGFGPGGTGAVYSVDLDQNITPGVLADLNSIYGAATAGLDPHDYTESQTCPGGSGGNSNFACWFNDVDAWEAVGRTSLGDIDISDDEQFLYVLNLEDRRVYQIEIDNPNASQTSYAFPLDQLTDPNVTMKPLDPLIDVRPFALTYRGNKLYVGAVNTEESRAACCTEGGSVIYVYSLNLDTGDWELELEADVQRGGGHRIFKWEREFQDSYEDQNRIIVADVEFDGPDMIIGLRDLAGDLYGLNTGKPIPGNQSEIWYDNKVGDIVRFAYDSVSGEYSMESNATAGSQTSLGANTGRGWPAASTPRGSYYYGDYFNVAHPETALGGLWIDDIEDRLYSTVYNPLTVFSAGVKAFDNDLGGTTESYVLVANSEEISSFGKTNGLGDIEGFASCDYCEFFEVTMIEDSPESCEDEADGVASANASGGVIPYQYIWSDGQTSQTATGLTEGTYEVTVTDDFGCEFIGSVEITTLPDNTPPSITCPSDITIQCNDSSDITSTGDVIFNSDNCDVEEEMDFSHSDNIDISNCGNTTGTIIRTFFVEDLSGNIASCNQTITIEDSTPPVISIQASDLTVECDGFGNNVQLTNWLNSFGGANATDECSDVVWTDNFASLSNPCGATGSALVIFTATDDCDNTSTTSATFTIEDTTDPTIDTPASDLNLVCDDANQQTAINNWLNNNGGAISTDVCSGTTVTWSHDYTPGDENTECGATGDVLVTFTATDDCDNTTTTTATITITDTTAPAITTEANDLTVECDGLGNNAQLTNWLNTFGGASATDECSDVVWTNNFTGLSNPCGATGSALVIFTATDDCDNTSTTSATFTIEDTTDPTLDTPATDLNLECDDANQQAAINNWLNNNGGAVSTDVCSGTTVTWSHDYTPGDEGTECGATGDVLVTFTATDDCDNTSITTATITISDTTAPTITAEANDLTVECDGSGNNVELTNWLNTFGGASATDECSDVVWTNNFTSLSNPCGATGSALVIFTATDDCDNTSTTSATFTIEDTTDPTIDSPASDLNLECDDANQQTAINNWLNNNGGAVSTDVCSGTTVTWSHDYTLGDENTECGATGDVLVTFTATDDCDNTSTTTATLTISDTTAPTITAEANDLTVECDGLGNNAQLTNWLNTFGGAAATDACSSVTWTNNFVSLTDDCGATGERLVVFTATDDCDNATTTSATFTIEDTTVPSIDMQASDLNLECDDVNQQAAINNWLNNNGGAVSTDVCSGTTVTWSHDYTPGDEDTECGATGDVLVTFTATDDCDNTSITTATITISDTTAPTITTEANDLTVECDGSGNNVELTNWLNTFGGASATDECSDVVWTNNFTSLSNPCGATGSALVIFTATDDCDNTSTTSATFTIEDTTDPTIDSPASDLNLECDDANQQTAINTWLNNNGGATSSDICDVTAIVWTHDYVVGDENTECGATGDVLVTFTATDNCGLFSTTTATITISDTTAPTITTEAGDLTVECDGLGNNAQLTNWLNTFGGAAATDACSSVTWTNNFVSLTDDCGATGERLVVFTATDDCDNATTTSATFTIEDTTVPSIDTQASDLNLECDDVNHQTAINTWLNNNGGATSSDICDVTAIVWTHDYTPGDENTECGATGDVLVTFTATDNCGLFSTTTATITISDTTAPTITTEAGDLTVECDGLGNNAQLTNWLNTFGGAAATDACSSVTWTNNFVSLTDDCGATGERLVVFTATDDCDNATTTSATFTIEDTTVPSIDTQASDLNLECDDANQQTAINTWLNNNGGATSSDICDVTAIVWTHDYTPGDENTECGATGDVLVTFTATDNCGLFSTTTATITISDTTAPTITTEAGDLTVECDGLGNNVQLTNWLNTFGGAAATDACSSVTWTNNFVSLTDDCGATGERLVVFTATDDCDNATTTSATFTIEDTTVPSIDTQASDLNLECDDANQQAAINTWLNNNGGATSSDICDVTAIVWTHDYTPGDENTECGATGDVLVTFTATDNCGLFSTTAATITISDTTAPTITTEAGDLTVECDGLGNNAQLTNWLNTFGGAAATDACSSVTWTNNFVSLTDDCGATGERLVVFTATDDCDNATTTSATFTIEDTTVPSIDTQASDLNLECDDANQQTAIDAWLANNGGANSTDICNTEAIVWTHDYTPGDENTECERQEMYW